MISGIYTIETPSGRCYVGSAVRFEHRWRVHLYNLRRGVHHCGALQNAYVKYGESALRFRKLLVCAPADLLFFEQRAIDSFGFKNLYNVAPTAGSQRGFKHSAATKDAYSAARKGVPQPKSAATIEKIATARRGKKLSVQARANQSAAQKGRAKSPEHVAKVAAANRGQKRSAGLCAAMSAAQANQPIGRTQPGMLGVSRKGSKWQARVNLAGKRSYLGYYATSEAAAAAVRKALAPAGSTP